MPISGELFDLARQQELEAAWCCVEDLLRAHPDLAYSAEELLQEVAITPRLMDYILEELEFNGVIEHRRVDESLYYRAVKASSA